MKDPKYSTASDLWGVGIILFEAVSNVRAYSGKTMKQDIMEGKVNEIPETVCEPLRKLIKGLLSFEPQARIAEMEAFLRENANMVA